MKAATSSIALAFLFVPATNADTMIDFRNQGKDLQFLTDGKTARINTRGSDDYMLVKFEQNKIFSVNPEKKQVTNISDALPSIGFSQPPEIKLTLKPLGKGPAVAGYATTRYRLTANGEYCGSLYASREALQGSAIEEMFDTLKTMADNHLQSLGGFAALIPTCQLAQIELAGKLEEVGAPMRMTSKDGSIDSEITKILKDVQVKTEHFALPSPSQLASTDKNIGTSRKQHRQQDNPPEHQPEPQRSLRPMPPYSRIPPEAVVDRWRYPVMIRHR